jgi:hypothetical protein
METYNLYTLKLKLQKHKIAYYVNSSEGVVIKGVRKIIFKVILLIVLPIVVGLSLIVFGNALDLGFLEPIGFIILVLLPISWIEFKISMEKQYCTSEVFKTPVTSAT